MMQNDIFQDYIDVLDMGAKDHIRHQITNRDRLLYTLDGAAERFPEKARNYACSGLVCADQHLQQQLAEPLHDQLGGYPQQQYLTRREVLEADLASALHTAFPHRRFTNTELADMLDELDDEELEELLDIADDGEQPYDIEKMSELSLLLDPARPTTLEEIETWDRGHAVP